MREALESSARQLVGQVLHGKWRIDRLIDVGGMGAVFAATHRNGNRVAIKILHSLYSSDPGIRRRFLEEGYVANKVGHADSVTVLDDDELEDGTVFLVMELLEGESLEARMKRRGVLEIHALALVVDRVLDVLAAGHDKGIVHRDIKPPNVFLTRDGNVKVLDYGLARVRERSLKGSLTKTGMVVGTASYMPPEQARGKRDLIDARTDIWAVGATMFKAVSGHYVHEGGTINERLIAAMSERARSVVTVAPGLAEPFAGVIDRALAFQRADRYQTARDMQSALRDAYEAALGRVIPGSERQPVSVGSWSQAAGVELVDDDPTDVDLSVSVVFDTEPGGDSVIVELEDEAGKAERFELRSKKHEQASAQDDDLSEVSIVELDD